MRKFITPLVIGLAVTGSAYALIANLFPDTLDFPRVPTWDGTIGGTISLILGGVDIASYVGDGTVENTQKLGGFTGTGYLKNRECLNTDVWLSIGSSGIPNCGLTGSLLSMNIGTLTGVVGSIVITKPDSSTMAGVDGVELYAGDILSTAGASSGTLAFSDASLIRLDELTTVELTGGTNSSGDTIAQIILSDGNLWGRVLTSTGIGVGGGGYIAGVRGTSISVEKSGTGFIFAIVDSIISDTGAVDIRTSTGIAVAQIGSGAIFANTGGVNRIYYPGKISLLSGSIWRSANTVDDMEYLFRAQNNPAEVLTDGTAVTVNATLSGAIISKTQQELLATIPLQDDTSMCEIAGVSGCNDVIIGDIPDELKATTGAITAEQIKSQREVQAKSIICESKYGGVFWPTIGGCVISPPGKTIIWMADYANLQDQSLVKQPPMNPTMITLRDNGAGIPPIKGKNFRIPSRYEIFSGTTIADNGNIKNNALWNDGKNTLNRGLTPLLGIVGGVSQAGTLKGLLMSATSSGFTEIHIPNIQSGSVAILGDTSTWGTWRYPSGVWFRMPPNPLTAGPTGIELNFSGQYIAYPLSEIGGTGALLGKTIEIELASPIDYATPAKGYVLDKGTKTGSYYIYYNRNCTGTDTPDRHWLCMTNSPAHTQIMEVTGLTQLSITGVVNPNHLVFGNIWNPGNSIVHLQGPIKNTIKSIKILAPQTCSDGIKNNGETYVDCGGPNCSACISIAGICDNSRELGCSAGLAINASNTPGCHIGTTTWNCSGSRGGAMSDQCSIYHASCPIDGVCDNSNTFSCTAGTAINQTGWGCGLGTSTWNCSGSDGGTMSDVCSRPQVGCSCSEYLDLTWKNSGFVAASTIPSCYFYNSSGTSIPHNNSKTYNDIYAYPFSPNRSMGSITIKCTNGSISITSATCLTCNDNGIKDNGETGLDCGGGGCEACITCPAETQYISAGHSVGPTSYTSICMYTLPEQTSKESWEIITSGSPFGGEVSGYISTKCSSVGTRSTSSPMVPNWASSLGYLPGCYKNSGSTPKNCSSRPDMPYILSGGAYAGTTIGSDCYYE